MAYEPKEWQCGDTITADDLNRIEGGIAEASQGGSASQFVVNITSEADPESGDIIWSSDKTFQEVKTAYMQGQLVVFDIDRYHRQEIADPIFDDEDGETLIGFEKRYIMYADSEFFSIGYVHLNNSGVDGNEYSYFFN